jgi:hypothetical protein
MNIDQNRLKILLSRPVTLPGARELRRDGRIFFVGGELPVNETLETMFDSFCMESTDLFYLSFGGPASFSGGAEMARQIKKNFNVRLMGRIDFPAPAHVTEHAYAAGLDLLDIPLPPVASGGQFEAVVASLQAARSVFTRWSVASTVPLGAEPAVLAMQRIDLLLQEGIVPLAMLGSEPAPAAAHEPVLKHLVSGWKKHDVPIKPFLPLISYVTPVRLSEQPGLFRGLIEKLQDRRHLAASDLRRHLRVTSVENSLDSAGL